MTFQPGANLYTQGFGSRPENVEVPHYDVRAPATTDVNYPIGKRWVDYVNNAEYTLTSLSNSSNIPSAVWVISASGTGLVSTISGDTGTASPVAGDIKLAGTANQIATAASGKTVTLSLIGPYTPATYTAHGVLIGEGTSSIVATAAGSAGQILTSGGASADPTWTTATYPATVVAGSLIAATATNVVGSIADVATGQALMSGGVGVIPAYSGSPSFSGSVTAATTITATAGAITATNGNLVLGTAGNKIVSTSVASTTTAGANSFGTVTLVNGTATINTSAVTASSIIMLTRQSIGSTGAAALGMLSVGTISAGNSFVINALVTANATSNATTDVSVIGWMIIN